MLDIPEEVKNLFHKDSINKNFRVHFPNGERDDIVNGDIIGETVQFTESFCSQDNLKFGLCEASIMEFECVNVGNIRGVEIECRIEIDITSLGEELINEYGQTAADVPFPFYPVSYGRFVVESCKRQADMRKRKVVAYDALYGKNLDKDLSEMGISKPSFLGIVTWGHVSHYLTDSYSGFFRNNVSHYLRLFAYNSNVSDICNEFGEPAGEFAPEEGSTEYTVPPLLNPHLSGLGVKLVVKDYVYEPQKDKVSNFGLKSAVDLIERSKHFNKIIENTLSKHGIYLDDVTVKFKPSVLKSIQIIDKPGTETGISIPLDDLIYSSDFAGIERMKMQIPVRFEIYSIHSGDTQIITPLETVTFNECPALKMYNYDSESVLNFELNEESTIPSYRSMLGGYLELSCLFGRIDRMTGKLEYVGLGEEPVTLDKSMYKSVWMEEYTTKKYGAINAKYTDTDGNEQMVLYKFGEDENIYYMHDNAILSLVKLTESQVTAILSAMAEKIAGITMMPFELACQGIPYLEAGDLLKIETDSGIITSYLLRREMSGIIGLEDEITNTIAEQAKKDVDNTKVIIAMSGTGGDVTIMTKSELESILV